ncbi:hypothetical protein GQ457_02G023350 [Hibiscus cannabinus]
MLRTVPPSASIDDQHNAEFQLSKEGPSFGALLDTQGDSVLDVRMESDGINNGLISKSVVNRRMNKGFCGNSNDGGSLEIPLQQQHQAMLGSRRFIVEFEDKIIWPCNNKGFRGNSNDGGSLEIPLQQQHQAMLGLGAFQYSIHIVQLFTCAAISARHWVLCQIYNKNNKKRPLEVDEDDSEDDMLCTVPPSVSIDGQLNVEFQLLKEGSSFGALLDTQGDSVLDARMEIDYINNCLISNQLSTEGSSFKHYSILKTMFDAMMGSGGINNVFVSNQLGYSDLNPLKMSLSSLYCIEFEDETTWPCNSMRFHGNSNDVGSLEIPMQQQHQAVLGTT